MIIITETYKVNEFKDSSENDWDLKQLLKNYKNIKIEKKIAYLELKKRLENNNFNELANEIVFNYENIEKNSEKFIDFFEEIF